MRQPILNSQIPGPNAARIISEQEQMLSPSSTRDYPLVAAVRKDGPAERAGLRNGDVVTKVDGFSVLEEKGALRLFRSEDATTLTITVSREGKEVEVLLRSN